MARRPDLADWLMVVLLAIGCVVLIWDVWLAGEWLLRGMGR